jgi:dolichol-phosphate mannosyltransferase
MPNQVTSDTAVVTPPPAADVRVHERVREGIVKPHNGIQFVKFAAVGASGYIVNLAAFWVATEQLGIHYILAAIFAFCFAVTNNFLWNRYWTFKASDGHAGFQAARFFVVSLIALAFNLAMLRVLVELGVGEFTAQAIAIVCATPLNFIGNKLWSFRL